MTTFSRHHRGTDQSDDTDAGKAEWQPVVASFQEELHALHRQDILSQCKSYRLAWNQLVISGIVRGDHVFDHKDHRHQCDDVVRSLSIHVEAEARNGSVHCDDDDHRRIDDRF